MLNIKSIINDYICIEPTSEFVGANGIVMKIRQVKDKHKCLKVACENGNLNLVRKLLLIRNIKIEILIKTYGKMNIPNIPYPYEIFHLQYACEKGNLDRIEILSRQYSEHKLEIYLLHACKSGNMKLINFLRNKVSNPSNYGLYGACVAGNLQLAKLFMESGKNIDFNGALTLACRNNKEEIIQLLLQNGASWCLACDEPAHNKYFMGRHDKMMLGFGLYFLEL